MSLAFHFAHLKPIGAFAALFMLSFVLEKCFSTLFNYLASRCDSHADLSRTGAPKALHVTDPGIQTL